MRSTDPDFLLHTAEHHFFNHSDALAYQALTQLLAQQRKHPRANELMALLMARAGHSAQALKHFDIASNSDTKPIARLVCSWYCWKREPPASVTL